MGAQQTARRAEGRGGALARRERRLAALARKQHGALSRQQLVDAGLGPRTIARRVEAGRLHPMHRGVYVLGHGDITPRGKLMAAVLACGDGAVLSHRSAAALWGLSGAPRGAIEVSAPRGRQRRGIAIRECGISKEDRTFVHRIPVTSVARTLFDVAEVVDGRQLERAFEEADRLGLVEMRALEGVCARGHGRHALAPIRRLIDAAAMPEPTRTALEARFLTFCHAHDLPVPLTNVLVLDREVDAYWPASRLVVEVDSWSFHRQRAAFERDRVRDAAMQAAGYRVIRVTHRRLEREPAAVATELRLLLGMDKGRAGS